MARWQELLHTSPLEIIDLPEFRTLLLYRLKERPPLWLIGRLICLVLRPQAALYIVTPEIGPGLFIQHGFATIIAAQRIGSNCLINQQVTIGYEGTDAPVIGDDVWIRAGAKVLGAVRVGDGAHIAANAVVLKDVPAGIVAAGVPTHHFGAHKAALAAS